jgi:hypothetical protein
LLASLPLLLALVAGEPTVEDLAALRRGEVVVHREAATEAGSRDSFVAFVEVAAPSEKVWEAMLDFETLGYRSSLTREVTRYRQEVLSDGSVLYGIRYRLSVLGVDVVYHVLHRQDPARSRLSWSLDPTKANDLAVVDGSFEVRPTDRPDRVTVVYESLIDPGMHLPAPLDRYLRGRQLVGHLEAIRSIAEQKP